MYSSATETFDVMLNQTNIGANNNKYYVIQLLQSSFGGGYSVWFVGSVESQKDNGLIPH